MLVTLVSVYNIIDCWMKNARTYTHTHWLIACLKLFIETPHSIAYKSKNDNHFKYWLQKNKKKNKKSRYSWIFLPLS